MSVTSTSPRSIRPLWVVMLLVVSGLAVATSQVTSTPTAKANGYTPNALCADQLTPSNPVGADLFQVLSKDLVTQRAVTGSALIPVRADSSVPLDMSPPGRRISICEAVSEFDMSSVAAGIEFHLGVIAPDGFASQWYPSGDRARATVFRKRADNLIEARAFGSNSWTVVSNTVEVILNRGNSLAFSLKRAGEDAVGPYTACLVIWSTSQSANSLEYGGAFCNSESPFTGIGLRGIPLDSTFILELRNPPTGSFNPRGFLRWDGTSWGLVRTSGEATRLASLGDGQGISMSGIANLNLDIPASRQITGIVQDSNGNRVSNVCVFALNKARYFANEVSDESGQCNLANGEWTLGGLTGTEYLIYVQDLGAGIINGFYAAGGTINPNGFSAETFPFGGSVSISAGTATVQSGFAVTGTFTRPAGTYDVCVVAWKDGAQAGFREWVNGTCTSSNNFTLTVPEGDYRFEYSERNGRLKSTWNGGAPNYSSAQDVPVSGPLSLSSVEMSAGVTITGDLDLEGGGAFPGICVSAFDGSGNDFNWGEWLGGTCSISSTGGFSLGGLADGAKVKIRVDSSNGINRSAFYSSGGPVYRNSLAQVVTVTPGLASLGVTLSAGISISGTIRDGGGKAVQFACVSAISSSWEWLGGICSGADGSFTLSGLPADNNMRVWIQGPQSTPTLGGGWLQGPTGGWVVTNSAQPIDVSSNLSVGPVALRSAVQITGSVTTSAGADPPPTCISAFDATTFQWMGRNCTNRLSKYTIGGLPTGTSFVLLVEPQQSSGFRSGWLESSGSSVTNSATATLLTISSFTSSTATRDVTLESPPAGKITGVAELADQGLIGIVVMAKSAGSAPTSSAIAITTTGVGGTFTLGGLDPGTTYDVYFVDTQSPARISQLMVSRMAQVNPPPPPWKPTLVVAP